MSIFVNKLIYECIIGNDLLNMVSAILYAINNKFECKYKGIQHNITMNGKEKHFEVSNTPIIISKPEVQYA